MAVLCSNVFGQSDSTQYENGLPVTNDDTVRNFPSTDYYPFEKFRKLDVAELPKKVAHALKHESQYNGWERGNIYFDVNTQLYLIQIPRNEDAYVYGVNADGKSVSFDIYKRSPE